MLIYVKPTKICNKCQKTLSLSSFYKRSCGKYGVRAKCIQCFKKTNKENYLKNKTKRKKQDTLYRLENKAKIAERHKSYRANNRDRMNSIAQKYYKKNKKKAHARGVVQKALQSGKLKRPTVCCLHNEQCSGRIEGHHQKYDEPLNVVWYCEAHHRAWHTVFEAF